MSCSDCEERAEECFELDGDPCTCSCHGSEEYYRASGEMTCDRCGKLYRKHIKGGPVGMNDQRFLRRLCNGELVKL